MNTYITSNRLIKTALVTAMLAVGCAAMAQKPEWAGGQGKGKHSAPAAQAAPQPAAASSKAVPPAVLILPGEYFTEAQRRAILDYYASQQQRTTRCPPGLAKKTNGCMPRRRS